MNNTPHDHSYKNLIQRAAAVVKSHTVKGGLIGDVGCALLTHDDQIFTGVCAATGSNVFCAEKNALGSLLTTGVYIFRAIVAVWKDEEGKVFVIAPCGNCRQFMYETSDKNLEAEVVLSAEKTVTLRELLPVASSWEPVE